MNQTPPKLIIRFLQWFCPAALYEGIEGDLLEQFDGDLARDGIRKARWRFVRNTIRFFRAEILLRNKLKISVTEFSMLKSYFTLGFRNIVRQKTSSLINLTGISIALTFFLLAGLYIQFDFSFDKFNPNYKSIYRLESVALRNNQPDPESVSDYLPVPFQSGLEQSAAGIIKSSRFGERELAAAAGQVKLKQKLTFVDEEFLSMFSLEFLSGDPATALNKPTNIVLDEQTAVTIFATTDAIGKTVDLGGKSYIVSGVFLDLPKNSSLQYSALTRFENHPQYEKNIANWNFWINNVFIEASPSSIETVRAQLNTYATKNMTRSTIPGEGPRIIVEPMSAWHFDMKRPFGTSANILYSYVLGALVLVILFTACINYTLLSLAMQAKRSVEVGIRKISGASQKSIQNQFFGEMQLIVALAIPVSVAMAWVLLPLFNQVTGKNLSLSEWLDIKMIVVLAALLFLTGVIAALYPAIVLSRSSPQRILKVNASVKYKATVGNYLLVFQFACCFVLMIISLVMYEQMKYIQNKDLGFKGDQIISFSTENNSDVGGKEILERFRNALNTHHEIVSMSGLNYDFGELPMMTAQRDSLGKDHPIYFAFVDFDFFEMLEAKLVDGRFFDRTFRDDSSFNFVINETLAREINSKSVIGTSLDNIGSGKPGNTSLVIGVVKDFNFEPLNKAMVPMAFGLAKDSYNNILVKIDKDRIPEAVALLQQTWKKTVSDGELNYAFLDEQIAHQYSQYYEWLGIVSWSSGLGIFIAGLGLFGLTGLLIVNRTKEIGIRRVLGASVSDILTMISKQYVWLMLIAFMIAGPLAYYYGNRWLTNFAYHISLSYAVFVIPIGIVTCLMIVIIVTQSIRTIRKNPTESLRYE